MTCKICKVENVEIETFSFDSDEGVSLSIKAPLCKSCVEELPGKLQSALANPMLKSVLRVCGVNLGLC